MKYDEYVKLREDWNIKFAAAYKNLPQEPTPPTLNLDRTVEATSLPCNALRIKDMNDIDNKVHMSKDQALKLAKWIIETYE